MHDDNRFREYVSSRYAQASVLDFSLQFDFNYK